MLSLSAVGAPAEMREREREGGRGRRGKVQRWEVVMLVKRYAAVMGAPKREQLIARGSCGTDRERK